MYLERSKEIIRTSSLTLTSLIPNRKYMDSPTQKNQILDII